MHINILFCSKLGEGDGSNKAILRGVIQFISDSNLGNFLFITKDGKFLAFYWLNLQKIIEEQSGCNATSQAGFEERGTKKELSIGCCIPSNMCSEFYSFSNYGFSFENFFKMYQ